MCRLYMMLQFAIRVGQENNGLVERKRLRMKLRFSLFSTCAAILARKAVLPYLIKDGFVADIQIFCCCFTVPIGLG